MNWFLSTFCIKRQKFTCRSEQDYANHWCIRWISDADGLPRELEDPWLAENNRKSKSKGVKKSENSPDAVIEEVHSLVLSTFRHATLQLIQNELGSSLLWRCCPHDTIQLQYHTSAYVVFGDSTSRPKWHKGSKHSFSTPRSPAHSTARHA